MPYRELWKKLKNVPRLLHLKLDGLCLNLDSDHFWDMCSSLKTLETFNVGPKHNPNRPHQMFIPSPRLELIRRQQPQFVMQNLRELSVSNLCSWDWLFFMTWCRNIEVLILGFWDVKETALWSSEDQQRMELKNMESLAELVDSQTKHVKYLEMYYDPKIRGRIMDLRATKAFTTAMWTITERGVKTRRTKKRNVKTLW